MVQDVGNNILRIRNEIDDVSICRGLMAKGFNRIDIEFFSGIGRACGCGECFCCKVHEEMKNGALRNVQELQGAREGKEEGFGHSEPAVLERSGRDGERLRGSGTVEQRAGAAALLEALPEMSNLWYKAYGAPACSGTAMHVTVLGGDTCVLCGKKVSESATGGNAETKKRV